MLCGEYVDALNYPVSLYTERSILTLLYLNPFPV